MASIPILFTIVMMVGLNWPAKRVMPIAWAIALVLAAVVWRVPAQWLAGNTVSGALNALNILIIVFGATLAVGTVARSAGATLTGTVNHAITGESYIHK